MRHPLNPGSGWIWTSESYDPLSPSFCLVRER